MILLMDKKGPDRIAQMVRLIWAIAVRIYPVHTAHAQRLIRAFALDKEGPDQTVQADLDLCRLHMTNDTFSYSTAHVLL